jgi:acyl-CoA hydrolase
MASKTVTQSVIPLELVTYWTIMPKDTNYMYPLVFGGAMMSQVDLAAATHARMLLNWTNCDKAVTHKANFSFTGRSYTGDTIKFVSRVKEVRDNSIRFVVDVYRCPLPDQSQPKTTEFENIGERQLPRP